MGNKLYNISGSKSGNEETGFFNTKGRIGRNVFFLRVLLVLGVYLVSYLFVYFRVYDGEDSFHKYILPFLLGVFLLIQGAKRMHDVDRTGWAFLIPVYNLYLSLLPGTSGNNSYGIDPAPRSAPQYFDELDSFQKNSSGTLVDSDQVAQQIDSSGGRSRFRLSGKNLLLALLVGLLVLLLIYIGAGPDPQVGTAPTNITLNPAEVLENADPGIVVGTLVAEDVDSVDTHNYALVPGDGDTDNGSFAISGNSLTTAKSFDFESKNSYSVRIRVTDGEGLTHERELAIEIKDDVKDNLSPKSTRVPIKKDSSVLPTNKTKEFTFTCEGNLQEIKIEKYNNGKCDCPDGSDEPPGTCK